MKGGQPFIFIPQGWLCHPGARSARKMIRWIIFSEGGPEGPGQAVEILLPISFSGREAYPHRKMMLRMKVCFS